MCNGQYLVSKLRAESADLYTAETTLGDHRRQRVSSGRRATFDCFAYSLDCTKKIRLDESQNIVSTPWLGFHECVFFPPALSCNISRSLQFFLDSRTFFFMIFRLSFITGVQRRSQDFKIGGGVGAKLKCF